MPTPNYNAVQMIFGNTLLYWAIFVLYHAISGISLQYWATLCNIGQYFAILGSTLQYWAISLQYWAILCNIVYEHCREEGCIGLYIPDDQEISRGPRDVPRAKPEGHIAISGNTFTIIFNIHSLYLTMSTQLRRSWQYWTMLCCIWQYFCHTLLYSSNIGQYSCYNLQYPVNIFHSLSLTIPTTMQLLILCNDLQF